jgi:hypothetical protein
MFLAVILVCTIDGECTFRSLDQPFSTKFECNLSIEDGVEHFFNLPQIDYAEGRCIRWGQLAGKSPSFEERKPEVNNGT